MKADIQTIPELEAAIEGLLKKEKEDLQADVVTFHYYDEPYDRLILPIGLSLKEPLRFKSWLPSMDRIAGRVIKTGEYVIAEDAEHHPDTTGPFVYAENIKSSAGYPLITAADRKVGILFANYRDRHIFSKREISFLVESTTQIADTIDSWLAKAPNLRAELSELAGRRREAAALQEIVDTVRKVLGSVAVAIWTPGHQGDELVVAAQSGLKEHITRDARLSPKKACSVTKAFQSRNNVIGNVLDERIFPDNQSKAMRLNAIWAYPILSLNRSLGVFCVFPIEYDTLTPREETIIDAWVKQAAATIESHRNLLTLTTLHAMGRRLTSTLADPQLLMRDIVINAARVMNAESVSLHQYNSAQREFHLYDKSITHGIDTYPPAEKPRKGGISEYIVQHGLVRVTDISDVDPQLVRASNVITAGVKSYLGIRLKADEDVVGVLFFNYNEKREFSPDDVTIATTFANYAATAIHNSRIHRESVQRAERLDLVRQVAAAVSSATDVDEILQLAVDGLARVFDVKQCAVALYDDGGEFAVVRQEYLEPGCVTALGHRIPLKDNPQVDRIQETKKALIIDDVESDPIMTKTREILAERQTRSIMVVPIVIDDEVVGTIGVDAVGEKRHFTQGEADLAQAIADQASAAMRNARLIQQVTVRAEALKSLHEVGTELTSLSGKAEDLSEVLHRIATRAHTVLEADLIELYQYDQSQDKFALPPIRIGELYKPEVVKRAVLEDDILYPVIHLDQPKYTVNALKDEMLAKQFVIDRTDRPIARYVVREQIEASAAIPLKVGKEKVGVMFANFRTPQEFTEHQKELIELFASQSAIAIRNNRLYSQLQKSNQELDALQSLIRKLTMETDLDRLLREFLLAIHGLLGFEYAIVALVDQAQNTIEARHGIWQGEIDKLPEWIKMSKYPLDHEDIQADIVRKGQAEIISGWDDRFNREIWEKFQHERLLRIFMPIKIQDEVIGSVEAGYDKAHQEVISQEAQQTLQAFVNQAALAIQNAGQYQEIQKNLGERLNDIRALQDITEQMHQGDLKAVLNLIAERAVELTGAKHGGVWLVNKTRTALEFGGLATRERYEELPPQISLGEESGNSFSKLVVLTRKSHLSGDVRKDENYRSWYPDTISELTVPIIYQEKVIGTINVENPYENCFTEEHQRLLEAMAGSAAVMVQNALLIERLEIVDRIGRELTSGIRLHENEILELIYQQASQLMDTDNMYIALYDDATEMISFPLMHVEGEKQEQPARRFGEKGMGKTEWIIQNNRPIFHATKAEAKEWYAQPGYQDYAGDQNPLPSWIGVPMQVGEKVLGVIATYHPIHEHLYSQDELDVLSAIARQAAIAVDNARLYYDVNQSLEESNDRLKALVDFGEKVTSGINLTETEIIDLIYQQASQLMDADNMYIALYDDSTKTITFPLMYVDGKKKEQPSRKFGEAGIGKTESIIQNNEPLFHATRAEAEKWYAQPGHQEYSGNPLATWIGVPIQVGQRVLGVISTYHPTEDHWYTNNDLTILEGIARVAAIALENMHLYEQARGEVVAAKQLSTLGTAIAALQHRINNTFNIIIPNVERLKLRVDLNDPTVVEILDIIERNARYTSAIISRIQEPLKEVEISNININAILGEIVLRKRDLWRSSATSLLAQIDFDSDESIPVFRGPSGQIAEIFDNLLDNAHKAMPKGGAVRVVSKLNNGNIIVRVKDSGVGISQEIQDRLFIKPVPSRSPGGGAGLGLWLSRLMLQSIGGDILIESSDRTGTIMLVTIPANQDRKES